MNPYLYFLLQAGSGILSLVSIIFTVILWGSLPDNIYMQLLTGLAGFALELCKFSLLTLAVVFLKKKQFFVGVMLLLVGGALFVVSISASVAFLESGQQARKEQSLAWQQRQETLRQLDKKIQLAESSAESDISGSYRARGLETLKNVSEWQEQRKELVNSPIEIDNGGFNAVSNLAGFNSDGFRLFAWLMLALLIDGCSVVGWAVLAIAKVDEDIQEKKTGSYPEYEEETDSRNHSVSQINESTETHKESVTLSVTKEKVLSMVSRTEYEAIREQIKTGLLGSQPGVRKLMANKKIGYSKASEIFSCLESEGVVRKEGNSYELIGQVGLL